MFEALDNLYTWLAIVCAVAGVAFLWHLALVYPVVGKIGVFLALYFAAHVFKWGMDSGWRLK